MDAAGDEADAGVLELFVGISEVCDAGDSIGMEEVAACVGDSTGEAACVTRSAGARRRAGACSGRCNISSSVVSGDCTGSCGWAVKALQNGNTVSSNTT
jgi:hypothetical protein